MTPSPASSGPAPPRAAFAVLALGVLAYAACLLAGDDLTSARNWLSPALYAAVAGVIALRAARGGPDRAAWAFVAAAVASYATGSLLYALAGRPDPVDVPLASNVAWLGFYPLAFTGVVLLL